MIRLIKIKYFLSITFSFFIVTGFSQVRILDLTKSNEGEQVYSFPLIIHPDKKIGQKINAYLQNDILENENIIADSNKVFKKVAFVYDDSIFNPGLTYISYQEELNTASVLSLSFLIESMAAYPETFPRYYNFDLQTGELIGVDQLLTEEGRKYVSKILPDSRRKLINERVAELKKEIDKDELEYVKETFDECNKEAEINDFYLNINGFRFYKSYCFPHVARSYDVSLDISVSFKILSRYLTAFGKKILSEIK